MTDRSVRAEHDRGRAERTKAADRRGFREREARQMRVRVPHLDGRDVARLGRQSQGRVTSTRGRANTLVSRECCFALAV